MNRTQNVRRNISWGIVNKVILIALPFITRTVLLYKLGTQYLGLSSLFTSILSVLSLSELGFGQALVYSMYDPIAKNDVKKINALLGLYKKYYRIIGLIILGIGILLIPFLKKLIRGDIPNDVNINILYLIYLANTVTSYFLFAYKKSIFYASQRTDLDSNINTIISVIQNIVQIGLIIVFRNYYIFAIVIPLSTIINNIWISIVVNKKFPNYIASGFLDKDEIRVIFKNVKGLIIQKIGGVILMSVDNIVVSAFLGLEMVAIYNNYYYVVTALTGVLAIIMNALKPSVGNSIVLETIEKNYLDFKKFNFLYLWIVSWSTITMINLYQPFMNIWVGSSLMLTNSMAILFGLYFFINKWCDMMYVYQEAAGLWYENRFVPLIASITNLVLNIILVQLIGLSGILISTIVSVLFIYSIGYAYVLFKYYFRNKKLMVIYLFRQLHYAMLFCGIGILIYFICHMIEGNNIVTILIRGVICLFIPNILYLIIFSRNEDFISLKKWVSSKIITK